LDPATRALVEHLMLFAARVRSPAEAVQLERYFFDAAAKLTVIFSADRLPDDIDWHLLSDETNNFCQVRP
jgi:hypothetical protein